MTLGKNGALKRREWRVSIGAQGEQMQDFRFVSSLVTEASMMSAAHSHSVCDRRGRDEAAYERIVSASTQWRAARSLQSARNGRGVPQNIDSLQGGDCEECWSHGKENEPRSH